MTGFVLPPGLATSLWSVPVYLPYLQPPLTDALVAEAEAQLGVKLPAAYLALLRVQNGGYLRLQQPSSGGLVEDIAGIGPRYPSLVRLKSYLEKNRDTGVHDVDGLFPFTGDGHYWYCLDYRDSGRSGEPCVTYIDVEGHRAVDEVVAPDFLTLLQGLSADEDEIREALGLVTAEPLAVVAARLSEASGVPMTESAGHVEEYQVFCAVLAKGPGGVCLEPNRVRRGFVRVSDPDYAQLKDMLPELAPRFPDLGDCDYFLSGRLESAEGRALARAAEASGFRPHQVQLLGYS